MRELILLRHAHALPAAAGQDDRERPLSDEGQREALEAGRWLKEHGSIPGQVLCSPARRTLQTLAGVEKTLGPLPVSRVDAIYEATPGDLLGLIDVDQAQRLLLVGHNPGLEQLLALLTSGQSSDHRGMPPGAIAVLHFADGAQLEPGGASVHAFWWP